MKALSLFTGIGGIDLAAEWAGIETVAMCERDPFCQKVLTKHWPNIPLYDDVCTLTKEGLENDGIGTIELIHGGYPCQPFSVAGNREGEKDNRHLWPEVFRLVESIRPRWFVGENVAGHVTLGLDQVLSDLGNIGYTWQSFIIPACAVNAPHRRERVIIVANAESEQSASSYEQKLIQAEQRQSRRMGSKTDILSNSTSRRLQGQGKPIESIYTTQDQIRQASESFNVRFGGQWEIEPSVGRVANGVPNGLDRLKSLGNAVVPQQIYPILAAIKQIDDMIHAV